MSQTTSSSDLAAYRQQAFNFIASLSIKYSPISDVYNTNILDAGGAVNQTDPTTWKYYLNLQGLYHSSDTTMTVVSLDTKQTIDFTVANLVIHTKTAAAYIPGTSYYNDLCARYPGQVDLVKSIVYPISDLNRAIDADDFTILKYGDDVLEPDEFSCIYEALTRVLTYISTRWNFGFLNYEPYYPWVIWGLMWQMLVGAVFEARVQAIKTVNVHSFHIWEYLTSRGLSDYRSILSRRQSMFLYRNIDYLLANRGKQSNLILLVNNLLDEIGVGLYGRVVYQQTIDGAALCELTPELVATIIPTVYANIAASIPPSTISDMNLRLIAAGDEVDQSAEYVNSVERTLGDTTLNTYPTKLVEIRPLERDKRYADFFNLFVLDTLVYAITQNQYSTTIDLSTPLSSVDLEMTLPEAMAFYYYCVIRSIRNIPTLLPTQYTSYTAFSLTPTSIPDTVNYRGNLYRIANLVDLNSFVGGQKYPALPMTTPLEFSNILSQQFLYALNQIVQNRATASLPTQKAMRLISDCLRVNTTYPLDLIPTVTTYDDWLNNHRSDIQALFSIYDESSDPADNYASLADAVLSQIIPITSVMTEYGNFTITDDNYAQLKQLFIQLCSYNITFLDTDRDINQFFYSVNTAIDAKLTYTSADAGMRTTGLNEIAQSTLYSIESPPSDQVITVSPAYSYKKALQSQPKITAEIVVDRTTYIDPAAKITVGQPSLLNRIIFSQTVGIKVGTFSV